MKRVLGWILLIVGIVINIYFLFLFGYLIALLVGGAIFTISFLLLRARDIAILNSELKEEEDGLRLHIKVKNNQKRNTSVSFVANIYHNGTNVGTVNSNSIVLNGLETGELIAVFPQLGKDVQKDAISWKIIRWNFN